jgi:lipopolysaccharide export system permease protein
MAVIITRYLFREIIQATVAITGILLLILLSNQFVILLSRAVQGDFPATAIAVLIALSTPGWLVLLLPLGLFLGILFTYGRWYADNEMAVLFASGVSILQLVFMTLIPASLITALVAWLSLIAVPTAYTAYDRHLAQAEVDIVSQIVSPGRFQASSDGRFIVYVESLTANHEPQNIFIADQPKPTDKDQTTSVVFSQKGRFTMDSLSHQQFIVLKSGQRYQGMPGHADYKELSFDDYWFKIRKPNANIRLRTRSKSLAELWDSEKSSDFAELMWRLSIPVSVLVLALLAIPLSRSRPRRGKFARFLPAILVFIIYYNALALTKSWVEDGALSAFALWSVHLIGILVAVVAVMYQSGYFTQVWKRFQ